MLYRKIKYLGGLPFPFNEVANITIVVNSQTQQIIFEQDPNKIIVLSKFDIISVKTDIKHDRSISQGIVGYVIGNLFLKKTGGLLGAAIGGREKDKSMVYINYKWNFKQNTIVLLAKEKTWDLFASINSLII